MSVLKPDEYGHQNPNLAFVDSDSTRGGARRVANRAGLYALAAKVDQLKENVTVVTILSDADNGGAKTRVLLSSIANVGNAQGWELQGNGGGSAKDLIDVGLNNNQFVFTRRDGTTTVLTLPSSTSTGGGASFVQFTHVCLADGAQSITLPTGALGYIDLNVLDELSDIELPVPQFIKQDNGSLTPLIAFANGVLTIAAGADLQEGDVVVGFAVVGGSGSGGGNTFVGDQVAWQPGAQRLGQISFDTAPQNSTKAGFYFAKTDIANSQTRPSANATNYTFIGGLVDPSVIAQLVATAPTSTQKQALDANPDLSAANPVADKNLVGSILNGFRLGFAYGEESITVGAVDTPLIFGVNSKPRPYFIYERPEDVEEGSIADLDISSVPVGGFFQIRSAESNLYSHVLRLQGGLLFDGFLSNRWIINPGDRIVFQKGTDGLYTVIGTDINDNAYLPLSGTKPGKPITGDLELASGTRLVFHPTLGSISVNDFNSSNGGQVFYEAYRHWFQGGDLFKVELENPDDPGNINNRLTALSLTGYAKTLVTEYLPKYVYDDFAAYLAASNQTSEGKYVLMTRALGDALYAAKGSGGGGSYTDAQAVAAIAPLLGFQLGGTFTPDTNQTVKASWVYLYGGKWWLSLRNMVANAAPVNGPNWTLFYEALAPNQKAALDANPTLSAENPVLGAVNVDYLFSQWQIDYSPSQIIYMTVRDDANPSDISLAGGKYYVLSETEAATELSSVGMYISGLYQGGVVEIHNPLTSRHNHTLRLKDGFKFNGYEDTYVLKRGSSVVFRRAADTIYTAVGTRENNGLPSVDPFNLTGAQIAEVQALTFSEGQAVGADGKELKSVPAWSLPGQRFVALDSDGITRSYFCERGTFVTGQTTGTGPVWHRVRISDLAFRDIGNVPGPKMDEVLSANVPFYPETDSNMLGRQFVDDRNPAGGYKFECMISQSKDPQTGYNTYVWVRTRAQ
jgi:hypothetical protein